MTTVTLERHDSVCAICVDNPPVNALSESVRSGIIDALDQALADETCLAIVIHCAGRTFIAGADIREFNKPPTAPFLPDVVHAIEDAGKPVIAAIHGTALGGGLEVAMGCHYRIALASAKLGLPEVNLGLLPGATGTQRLPRLVGIEKALDMMLTGKPISAAAAHGSGLVDELVSEGDLLPAALRFASSLAERGPRRVREVPVPDAPAGVFDAARQRIAKRQRGLLSPEKIVQCVEASATMTYSEGCELERNHFLECKDSPQSDGLRHAFFAERGVAKVPGIGKETARRTLNDIAVLGAGTMGAGIAFSALCAGASVFLLDNQEEGLERGRATIAGLFDQGIQRGKLTRSFADEALARLTTGVDYAGIADVDLVIEAVFESMAVKKEVFARLDQVCKAGAILATNTSTLDVDEIAAATSRPSDVIGLHFFSPAHIMRLLEIVRGRDTAADVIATSLDLAKRLGKIGVVVGNCFGFVGNRMLYAYGRENQLMLLEGAAPEYIDKTLFDWGMAMGPNAVGDLAGLDVGYKVRQERTDLPDDPRFYRIADVLVEQGRLGQKSGAGMYRYEEGSRKPLPDPDVQQLIEDESKRLGIERRDIDAEEIVDRCILGLVLEGARLLEEGVALRSGDIDVVWINGYGFPRHRGGPMHWADRRGLADIVARVDAFSERMGALYWEVPPLLRRLAADGETFAEYSASKTKG